MDEFSSLEQGLLHSDRRPACQPSLGRLSRWLVGVFVVYHIGALLVVHLPEAGIGRVWLRDLTRWMAARKYVQTTAHWQNWGLFAPNPPSTDDFLRAVIEDEEGRRHDLKTEVYRDRTYPYLRYYRRGKVHRRSLTNSRFQAVVGAWLCRQWERDHGGVAARAVHIYKVEATIHSPLQSPPWSAPRAGERPLTETYLRQVDCKRTPGARIPVAQRERLGLPSTLEAPLPPRQRLAR